MFFVCNYYEKFAKIVYNARCHETRFENHLSPYYQNDRIRSLFICNECYTYAIFQNMRIYIHKDASKFD